MDLIYEHPKRIGAEFCQKTIDAFENLSEMGCVRTRHDSVRRDNQTNLASIDDANMRNTELSKEFFGFIEEGLDSYVQKYNLQKKHHLLNIFFPGLSKISSVYNFQIANRLNHYNIYIFLVFYEIPLIYPYVIVIFEACHFFVFL